MNVVIVDDEVAGVRTLREMCATQPDLRVVGEYVDASAALAAIRESPPHLLFLDVQMEPLNGIELARALGPPILPAVVFVTAYDAYALEAFEVCAVDYLLKPFDLTRFRRTLERVRPRHTAPAEQRRALLADLFAEIEHQARQPAVRPRLLAEFCGHLHVLDADRIELLEADRNYVRIRVGADTYHARSTLIQAERALKDQPMLKVSRSCLVNVKYLTEINRTLRGDYILVLAGGATVTSSEGYRAKVKEYLGGLRV